MYVTRNGRVLPKPPWLTRAWRALIGALVSLVRSLFVPEARTSSTSGGAVPRSQPKPKDPWRGGGGGGARVRGVKDLVDANHACAAGGGG